MKLKAKYVVAANNQFGGVNIYQWYTNKKEAEDYARHLGTGVYELIPIKER